jgi:four helix bundle protein
MTAQFPTHEQFGLTSQMRRAAVSIPSNIAEGQARQTTREFVQFLSYAEGSAAELDTQVVIAGELGYCDSVEADAMVGHIQEVRRMLAGLRRKLTSRA